MKSTSGASNFSAKQNNEVQTTSRGRNIDITGNKGHALTQKQEEKANFRPAYHTLNL